MMTTSAWRAMVQDELKALKKHPDIEPFLKPVDVRFYSDYLSVVKHPICIQDIERLACLDTFGFEQLQAGFRQMISNSRLYSSDESSLFYKMTTRVAEEVDLMLDRIACFHSTEQSPSTRTHKSSVDMATASRMPPVVRLYVHQPTSTQSTLDPAGIANSKQHECIPAPAHVNDAHLSDRDVASTAASIPSLKRCSYPDAGQQLPKRSKAMATPTLVVEDVEPLEEQDDAEVPLVKSTPQQKALRRRLRASQLADWKKRARVEARQSRIRRRDAKNSTPTRVSSVKFASDIQIMYISPRGSPELVPSPVKMLSASKLPSYNSTMERDELVSTPPCSNSSELPLQP
eukprot:m.175591 g.175591  ORF g.175591 m.175591 type:complete len:345 (+) comp16785_c3_seq1:2259-3293(+)